MAVRDQILRVAARLLAESGGESLSIRAVCSAAGVGVPTLHHYFRDRQGLLDAVVAHGFEQYLTTKQAVVTTEDAVADLRRYWDNHVAFGLAHPTLYRLMYGSAYPSRRPAAADEVYRLLLRALHRAARSRRLRVPPDTAAQLISAAAVGVTLTLIRKTGQNGTGDLADRAWAAVLAAIGTAAEPGPGQPAAGAAPAAQAVALLAALDSQPSSVLSPTENALLHEWLTRLASAAVTHSG
ncbi:transcriptional regulator, TetR family [Goodfellowiella coeruleoviolacea]|uniref:Transcriptional regulator, TetR family n=2 Tax=Goodfellowiella coeruleoviolacea TaxID=334858 RepID=A0AAE3GD27_9PSEU|nr:transcriptional regulator, TetR family [Goodfellowiella coeruleoviolacea]